MSKQTSIFQFKVFKRITVHQGQVLNISNQPPQKRKLLKCSHCDEVFKSTQGLSIHVKCKYLKECVKEINTNRSSKMEFKQVEKQDNLEVKKLLEKMVDHVVKSEKEVTVVADEDKRPAANNRRGIVSPFTAVDLKFVKHLRWSLFCKSSLGRSLNLGELLTVRF